MSASDDPSLLRRIVRNPWFLIPVIFLSLLLIAGFGFRMSRIAGLPDIGDPFDVEVFTAFEVSDEENAFAAYRIAVDKLEPVTGSVQGMIDVSGSVRWSTADEEFLQWWKVNRPGLDLWREGTARAHGMYLPFDQLHVSVLLPVTQELKRFVQLALLEAKRREENGDHEEAWQWYRAVFRASRHSGMHGVMIERRAGAAHHKMAADRIIRWAAFPAINAELLRQALDDVQSDYQLTAPNSRVLKGEYIMWMNSLAQLEEGDYSLLRHFVPTRGTNSFKGVGLVLGLLNEPELSRRVVRQLFGNWLSQIDLRRAVRAPTIPGELFLFDVSGVDSDEGDLLPAEEIQSFVQKSLIGRTGFASMEQFDLEVTKEQARQAALVVLLAAQWYHREHGRYPEQAADLLTEYLDTLPVDPFARNGEPVRYRLSEDRTAAVWSIGQNGIDDNGSFSVPSNNTWLDIGYTIKLVDESTLTEEPQNGPAQSAADQ